MGTGKNSDIRINKKMRTWNKYKNYVFGGIALIVLIVVIAIVVGSCSKNGGTASNASSEAVTNKPTIGIIPETQPVSQEETQTETQTQATTAKVFTLTGQAASADFTQEAFYADSVFLGDSFVEGIEYYSFLGPDKVVSSGNITTDKATTYVADVASYSPKKVFIMIGINDLNYGSRTAETIASNYSELITQMQQALPSSEIYILSVLPITKAYESKSSVYITKKGIDDVNALLQGLTETQNVKFVDVSTAFEDSTGYLMQDATSNGLSINRGYYGFLLNSIATTVK